MISALATLASLPRLIVIVSILPLDYKGRSKICSEYLLPAGEEFIESQLGAGTSQMAVIVGNDYASRVQPWPKELTAIGHGSSDINIDVNKREREISNWPGRIGEEPRINSHVGARGKPGSYFFEACIPEAPRLVGIDCRISFRHSLEGIEEVEGSFRETRGQHKGRASPENPNLHAITRR